MSKCKEPLDHAKNMSKCGYGIDQEKANERECFGCHYLLADGHSCDWIKDKGSDELSGPSRAKTLL